MKKLTAILASIAFIGGIFLVSSCTEDDTGKPVISLTGGEKVFVTQYATFTDPGATVSDDNDENLTATVTGTVNVNSAGEYTLTYTATDAAGNQGTATRSVIVDGAAYVAAAYNVEDFTVTGGSATSNGTYSDNITRSSTTDNKINFTKFAFYVNAAAYGTISGTTITIPQQTINCGNPAANRTFTGSGTYAKDFTSFTLNYTETTNNTTATGYGVYTKN
jgi:hypothetical protein